jgi:sugar phosphate isomerase/epimerase
MLGLEELEIGLIFWAEPDALASLRKAKAFGVRSGQIGFPGDLSLEGAAEKWDSALTAENFIPITAVCSYVGEDYADIPTVANTVGLVPKATRRERIDRTKEVSQLARQLGIDSVGCHIGVIPPDHSDALYHDIIQVARELCDTCKENGQFFTLETGQEPAAPLLRFIEEVDRPNLKINFDPANMILYGTGDPIEALGVLGKQVVSVHCKDGDWPLREKPESLGQEVRLGTGVVDFPAFISKLKEIGYTGPLIIEREEPDQEKKTADVHHAVTLLRKLTGRQSQ